MKSRDWRQSAAADVEPLVTAEAALWLSELSWDVSEAWSVLEPARQAGQLPGFVVLDQAGRPAGWTAFILHQRWLQVMAIVAPDPESTAALVDAILASDEAGHSDSALVCVRAGCPGLRDALESRDFRVERYRYMTAPLVNRDRAQDEFAPWDPRYDERASQLFMRAYADADGIRAFAPDGTIEQWRDYLSGLRRGPGCGQFAGDLSLVAVPAESDRLDAAIMLTDLGPGTVHVAQFAVDPVMRRKGIARRMLDGALRRASARFRQATLLVSENNGPAVKLYEEFGFADRSAFIVATRRQRH